jgi:WD40 repeat protein
MVWNIQTRKRVAYVSPNFADWLAASPRGDLIAICGAKVRTGGGPGLYLWHHGGNFERSTIGPLEKPGWLLKFSPDGKRIAVGSHRGQQGMSALETAGPVTIADADSGKVIATISHPCRGFAWMPDSRQLVVTRAVTQTHEIYDAATGSLVRKLEGALAIGKPFVDRAGRRVMSVGADASNRVTIREWDVETARLRDGSGVGIGAISDPGAVRPAPGGFWNAVIGPDGNRVALSGGLGEVRLFDMRTQEEQVSLGNRVNADETLAFTADGSAIYVSGQGRFGLYEADSSRDHPEFTGPTGPVAVSPDKQHVVSCGDGVVIWDIPYKQPVITLSYANDGEFVSVDWSQGENRIAACRKDGSVQIWTLPIVH